MECAFTSGKGKGELEPVISVKIVHKAEWNVKNTFRGNFVFDDIVSCSTAVVSEVNELRSS